MTRTTELHLMQERARADRHATSFPLIVVRAIGFHDASFVPTRPLIPIFYGLPLAFVIVRGCSG